MRYVLLILAFALTACGMDPDEACVGYCDRMEECTPELTGCLEECREQNRAFMFCEDARSDYLQCVGKLSCDSEADVACAAHYAGC
jgi:hypothetical protein